MKITLNNSKCPSDSAISAYVDGTFSPDAKEAMHILHCSKCQEIVDVYIKIRDLVQKDANSIPQDVKNRIKRKVIEKLSCTRFEHNAKDLVLNDEEFECLAAAGTGKKGSKTKPKK